MKRMIVAALTLAMAGCGEPQMSDQEKVLRASLDSIRAQQDTIARELYLEYLKAGKSSKEAEILSGFDPKTGKEKR